MPNELQLRRGFEEDGMSESQIEKALDQHEAENPDDEGADEPIGHTPGPWIFDAENDGGIYGRHMKTYIGAAVNLGTGEGAANAKLMAAAPKLLSVLEALVEALAAYNPDTGKGEYRIDRTVEAARSAIFEARRG
jgi:hypothetical protein